MVLIDDFTTDSVTGEYTAFTITIDAELDTSMLSLKWYINGIEDTSKRNQLSVSFSRPLGNGVEIYTYRITDLTGTISAPDDVQVYDDFYEGLFNSDFGGMVMTAGPLIQLTNQIKIMVIWKDQ